jgi:leucyl/phenylalanyl-tRNA--protein transferase
MDEIVAVGLDLEPETIIRAYSNGIFPWPTQLEDSEEFAVLWFCPQSRAILPLHSIHYSRRLMQYLRKSNWHYTVNHDFASVIRACQVRKDEGTWITDSMVMAYEKLHKMGHAHSVEVWDGSQLVGGLYGVDIAGSFAGESMFHRADHASKAAILMMAQILKEAGRDTFDIQVMTPHMKALGAVEIPRLQFLKNLKTAEHHPINWAALTAKTNCTLNYPR